MDAALLGQIMAAGLFLLIILFLMSGYLVAFTLGGLAILMGFAGIWVGAFDESLFAALPNRFWGVITNPVLVAVPLFVFMGVVLERSGIAESLLTTMGQVFGSLRGGLALSVVLVGALLAAATGVVGATVVTMGLLSLPAMMRAGYDPKLACGTICAAGTLGQIIPPSTVLIFMADILQGANSAAQLALGNFAPDTVSVGDLFAGALLPSLVLVAPLHRLRHLARDRHARKLPAGAHDTRRSARALLTRVVSSLIPPITLIVAVLGSIVAGVATPTESASVGAVGALFLAAIRLLGNEVFGAEGDPRRDGRVLRFWLVFLAVLAAMAFFFGGVGLLNFMVISLALALVAILLNGRLRKDYVDTLFRASVSTMSITSMVFIILLGATAFALVFTQLGGGDMVRGFLEGMPGGTTGALLTVFAIIFVLGFFLDTFEILFIVVPITAPVLLIMGVDPIWLGVMMGVLLQTSFLTPPFGFSLFYLRGVAPSSITTPMIYRGAVPFIVAPARGARRDLGLPGSLATWLPNQLFRSDAPGSRGRASATSGLRRRRRRRGRVPVRRAMRTCPASGSSSTSWRWPKPEASGAAAEQCGISQPSLSVQLASLEKRLGQRLVERSRSGVILTPAGREVHERARAILEAATRRSSTGSRRRARASSGTIRFGASGTLGPYLLPHVIARLHARHPDLSLYIREAPPETLVAGLARGRLRHDPRPAAGAGRRHARFGCSGNRWNSSRPATTPSRRFERLPRAELARRRPCWRLGPPIRCASRSLDLCETLGARLRADYEGTSLDAIRLMAGMGMGLAFLPALYVRSEIGRRQGRGRHPARRAAHPAVGRARHAQRQRRRGRPPHRAPHPDRRARGLLRRADHRADLIREPARAAQHVRNR